MPKRFPRMLHNYVERRLEAFEERRKARFAAISGSAGMQAFVKSCRRKIGRIYDLPTEKCPLNTKVTGSLECKHYRIDKIAFESRPGFLVTGNLYVPHGNGPFPASLGCCGHSNDAKSMHAYQSFSARLAREGFVVLTYDPIGQGERFHFPHRRDVVASPCPEHSLVGNHLHLLGEHLASWFAWDNIRALDCLLERPEVDTAHVGATGISGGGEQTCNLAALDARITMAAPGCCMTTYLHSLHSELPGDIESVPPGFIAAGLEVFDKLTAFAPRPLMILAREDDYFDLRTVKQDFRTLQQVYTMLGQRGNVRMFVEQGYHGYGPGLQKAMVRFFCRQAGAGRPRRLDEDIELKTPAELQVTRTGQVLLDGGRSVFHFTRQKLRAVKKSREGFSPNRLRRLLQIPCRMGACPDYRVLRPRNDFSRFAVQTDPDVFTMVKHKCVPGETLHLVSPENPTVYVPHVDSEEDAAGEQLVCALAGSASKLFFVEPRGMGESVTDTCFSRGFLHLYDGEYMCAAYCAMMGFSLCGKRVTDVLQVLKLLRQHGAKSITLAGRGMGSILALFAAALDRSVSRVVLGNYPVSFEKIVRGDLHAWPYSMLPKDMLLWFDVPDVIRFLRRTKSVRLSAPWDENFERVCAHSEPAGSRHST